MASTLEYRDPIYAMFEMVSPTPRRSRSGFRTGPGWLCLEANGSAKADALYQPTMGGTHGGFRRVQAPLGLVLA